MSENIEFVECDECKRKSGTPILCEGCIANRDAIESLKEKLRVAEGVSSKTQPMVSQPGDGGKCWTLNNGLWAVFRTEKNVQKIDSLWHYEWHAYKRKEELKSDLNDKSGVIYFIPIEHGGGRII